MLILSALRGNLQAVVDQLGPNFRGVVGGSPEGTLLHHAAWVGNTEVVRTLLALGADARAPSPAEYSSPLAWAVLASGEDELPGRDFVSVARLLVENGAEVEPRFVEVAAVPLLEWLLPRVPAEL